MENYSLLMGAAAVMKMAVEMAAVSMEKPSGGTSPLRQGAGTETLSPDLGFAMAALWKLMTDRFEMSMMGEMRFFLGFEIKQLRDGTFINQAKYLQDMLKRFKMMEMKGVATPMVTKCHLALDPNGGGSQRRRPRGSRSSDEFARSAPHKSATMRRKGKATRTNNKVMDSVSYAVIRWKNWYEDVERELDIEDPRFWCMEQLYIFKDIYEPMKKVRPMQAIDVELLSQNDHFEDAERLGLHKLMKVQCDFSVPLIKKFYATLSFKKDGDRTMQSMSGTSSCEASFHKFAELLGYPFEGGRRLHGPQRTDKVVLYDLYTEEGAVGTITRLLPIYDQLLRFFRATITPSGGNNDAIQGVLVNLLRLSCECAQDDDESSDYSVDVMDFIFHEIFDAIVSRTSMPYAPYIQLLINNTAVAEDMTQFPFEEHKLKKAYVKRKYAAPVAGSFMGDAHCSAHAPGRPLPVAQREVKKLKWFQRNVLCMNIEIHKENFETSRQRAEIQHTQAVILHRLGGEHDPPPQPPVHPTYSGWHSSQVPWSNIEHSIQESHTSSAASPPAADSAGDYDSETGSE
ncbi:hypothetical protein QYE76_024814 [Lolium multiflorum]|uniref:Reverse transcriptase Ty1/copia-type domain-containing protein n=1 Tax=Lolium multiflorum TaxID=4521 RepID=A0AAD8RE03_LOLMU|nr:hypothetical protein QYE76_024814 [Lolium multiflorum]